MLERLPMLMNSVIASLRRTWSTCDWRSSSTVACASYVLVCLLAECSRWTLWKYSVTEINLVIYFEWLFPCLLLKCKQRSFFAKVTLSNSCFVAVFRVLHFTRYETTILRCGGLYYYCLVYKVFLHICWKFDENTYTITQIMTNNVRFLFFCSQCTVYIYIYIYIEPAFITRNSGIFNTQNSYCLIATDLKSWSPPKPRAHRQHLSAIL